MAATLRIEMPVGKTVRIIDQASPAIDRITDRFKKLNDTTREGRWLFGELDKAVEKVGYRMRSSRREVTAFDESLKKCIDRINELSGMRFNLRLGLDDSLIAAKLRQLQADFPLMFNVDGLESRLDTIIKLMSKGEGGGIIVQNTPSGNSQSLEPFIVEYGEAHEKDRNLFDFNEFVESSISSVSSAKDIREALDFALTEDRLNNLNTLINTASNGSINFDQILTTTISGINGGIGIYDIVQDRKIVNSKTATEAEKAQAKRDAATKSTIIGAATVIGAVLAGVVAAAAAPVVAIPAILIAAVKGAAIGAGIGGALSVSHGTTVSNWVASDTAKDKREEAVLKLSSELSESYARYKDIIEDGNVVRGLIDEYREWEAFIASENLPAEYVEVIKERMDEIKELLSESFPDVLTEFEAANNRGARKLEGLLDLIDEGAEVVNRTTHANYLAYDRTLEANQQEYGEKKAETDKAYQNYDRAEDYYLLLQEYEKVFKDENSDPEERKRINIEMNKLAQDLNVNMSKYRDLDFEDRPAYLMDLAVAEMVEWAEAIMKQEGDLATMEKGLIDYYNQSIDRIPGIDEALERMSDVSFLEEKRKQIENEEISLEELIAEIQERDIPDYEILGETYEELEESVKRAIEDIVETFSDQIDAIHELNVKTPELNSIYKKDISHFTYVPAEVQEAEAAVTEALDSKRGKALSTPYYDEIQEIYDDYGFFGRLFKGKKYRAEINEVNNAYGEDTISKNKQAKATVNAGKQNAREIAELEAVIQENVPKLVDYSMLYKNDEINKLISDLTNLRKIRESLNEQDKNFSISKKTLKEIQEILPDFEYDPSDALGSLQNLDEQILAMQSTTADVITEVGALDNDLNVLGNKKVGVSITLDVVENRRLPMRINEVPSVGTTASGIDPGPNRLPPKIKYWATGGILSTPHLGIVAEDGPEAIIPLSGKSRSRGLELWQEAGRLLGVASYGVGNSLGSIADEETEEGYSVSSPGSLQQNDVHVNVQLNPTFQINQEGSSLSVNAIKDHLNELIDDMAGEMATKLEVVFSNMPKNA